MGNTYSQIYIQVVFAVQGRPNLLPQQNKEELHKYMTGIVRERDQSSWQSIACQTTRMF